MAKSELDRAYSELAFEKKLEKHRREKEEFKNLQKKRKKDMETPEEKILRRMAKKLRKVIIKILKKSKIFINLIFL